MKLRIRGDSIRLRLTKSEVADLRERGSVEESVRLTPTALTYRIERTKTPQTGVTFDGSHLVVTVPDAVAMDFCDSERVGFEQTNQGIRVLVEKDWQCLAARDEDDADAFPHPSAKPV